MRIYVKHLSILRRGEDGNYVLNLGNLAPGERCVIDLHYGQLLQFEQGGLRLKIPTVIAPRYGDLIQDGGLQPHQVPETDLLSEYGFDLSLTLHGALAQSRVGSPSHPINVSHEQTSEASGGAVTVNLGRDSYLDRDFVLVMDQLQHCSLATVAHDYLKPEQYVVTASFCPTFKATDALGQPVSPKPLCLKILVDCSGSMAGDSIQAARRALHAMVACLGKEDTFSLSKFGDKVEHRSRAPWPVTEATQLSAQRWISSLDGDMGGTELEPALTSTLALSGKDEGAVLLITDGHVSAIEAIIKRAKSSKQRVFVIGIGSSASEGLLRRLAIETKGACDFVAPGEAVEPAILRMFNRMRTHNVHDVTLKARLVGDAHPQTLGQVELKAEASALASNTLSRLAAAKRLSEDLAQATQRKIALDYQLVSQYTSFLLIHQRAEQERALEMPRLHKIKQMLPAGYGGSSQKIMMSCSMASYTEHADLGTPSLLRNPRQHTDSALADESLELLEAYSIPAFLRRGLNDTPSSYQAGEVIKLNRTRIWYRIEINGNRERAIINKSPTGVGVRVWFFNDLDQIYSFVDYSFKHVAEGVLLSLGFVKMPKQLSELSPWARIKLTWKARE
jgi:Ca-activated chloride channel family protein